MSGSILKYGTAKIVLEYPMGVKEASGIAPVGDGSFLVVDDENGVFRWAPDSGPVQLGAGRGLVDLEGIAIAPDLSSVCILSEDKGTVWRFKIEGGDLGEGELLGPLPQLTKKKNRGWEGIAFAVAGTLTGRLALVAVHQAKPRRIGLFDAETLEQHALIRLPKNARDAIGQLNDVAIDAAGRILLLSGKRGRIAQMRLKGGKLSLQKVYLLDTSRDEVPEGISVDAEGRVWICTDGKGRLLQIDLEP